MQRTVRYSSTWRIFRCPIISIAQGPDPTHQELRGHAKGLIAIGDTATGVIAIGGLARGLIAIGGVAVGGITVAGVGIGAFVIAGVALAQTAFGGVAVGQYAKGGVAVGAHVISAKKVDETAVIWFRRLKLHSSDAAQKSQPAVTEKIE